jgi:hypothetical protein
LQRQFLELLIVTAPHTVNRAVGSTVDFIGHDEPAAATLRLILLFKGADDLGAKGIPSPTGLLPRFLRNLFVALRKVFRSGHPQRRIAR